MIATETMAVTGDSELVQLSLSGDREAFGHIVSRYQNLICSLAYSATGSLGQSEDLAQETFITAWKRLGHLRKPNSLRAWLCGIARNRINNALRREGREPLRDADPLEALRDSATPEPLPRDNAITNEEAAILWRSLDRIPATYREPLILYYREQESVENVAADLDLSEEAVRQRLSRGRKLLQEEVHRFVEGALARTRPQQAFTLSVLASLPALSFSAKAAVLGAAAKGTTAKATGGLGVLSALLGPLIVFVPNYIAYRVTLAGAHTAEERRGIQSFYRKVAVISLAVFVPLAAGILWFARQHLEPSMLSGLLAGLLVVVFLPTILFVGIASSKKSRQYYTRILAQEYGGVLPKPAWEFCSRTKLFGWPLVHVRIGDRFAVLRGPVKAWIAVGHSAVGGLFAFGAGVIAPISVGGFSVGLLSCGGLALGGVALGGIAVGVWPIWGGLLIGWQAFNGCFAIAWNAAVGLFALAHDYALGHFAFAAEANTEAARQVIFPNRLFRCAEFTIRHWLWLNLFWIVPFFILWRTSTTRNRRA